MKHPSAAGQLPTARSGVLSSNGRERAGGPPIQRTDGPRERLRRLGAESLSEVELLSLVVRTGSPSENAMAVASALLARSGGLAALCELPLAELCAARGVGPAKAASLLAAAEIGRRVATRRLERGDAIRGPEDIHRHFYQRMRRYDREHFVVLLLDGRHRVMGEDQVSQGTLTASLVHPREVFRSAVRAAAAALVLVHNHPSGDPTPSAEDREVTRRLSKAGELLGIRIVDHVVVAEQGYHSFCESGELG
jgi:DNA repair protein RadC